MYTDLSREDETKILLSKPGLFCLKIGNPILNQTKKKIKIIIGKKSMIKHMLKMISSINKSIDNKNKKNNFDFLTLREDFRLFGERINNLDRKNLLETFKTVELIPNSRRQKNVCPPIYT